MKKPVPRPKYSSALLNNPILTLSDRRAYPISIELKSAQVKLAFLIFDLGSSGHIVFPIQPATYIVLATWDQAEMRQYPAFGLEVCTQSRLE
jgi:hypothetical protein